MWSLKSILIDCCVSELHAHLCPYIVMYGLRLFIVVLHCLPNYLHVCMISCNHFTKFCCSTLSGSDIAKCIAWGCFFFSRTTLFTTTFTVIIVVCSLKSMCIPSFVLIGYCVHGHICPYRNVGPETMYCLHCLLNCLHVCMIRVRGWYQITKFCYSTLSGFWDS